MKRDDSNDNSHKDDHDDHQETHPAFARLRDVHLEPSPFMKHRVLARVSEKKAGTSKELWFWRALAGGAITLCAVLVLRNNGALTNAGENVAYAQQSYVIHLALNDSRLQEAVVAGIELPEGVSFYSKSHPEVAELRTMELAITPGSEGPTRLPFVVKAEHAGVKQIKMKFYNANRELVYEKYMSVRFAEKSAS